MPARGGRPARLAAAVTWERHGGSRGVSAGRYGRSPRGGSGPRRAPPAQRRGPSCHPRADAPSTTITGSSRAPAWPSLPSVIPARLLEACPGPDGPARLGTPLMIVKKILTALLLACLPPSCQARGAPASRIWPRCCGRCGPRRCPSRWPGYGGCRVRGAGRDR